MRIMVLLLSGVVLFSSCGRHGEIRVLQAQNDSLKNQLSKVYKPGFGEFMSGIQQHHAKLWFAGINENWELADFEIHEIVEALGDLQTFQSERKETSGLISLQPAIDTVSAVILAKDAGKFRSSFALLTTACNHCHEQNGFGFNRVVIPFALPVVNQDFAPVLKKVPLQATH